MKKIKNMNVLTRMASRLAAADGHEERYRILLQTFQEAVGGDAVALLRKEGKARDLVACRGLSPDALNRRFQLEEHPRLDVICH